MSAFEGIVREPSAAGHSFRGKFRVYGEGSVRHNGNPCDHGLDLQYHPLITREDWPSRRAYQRNLIANWWSHQQMRRLARRGVFERLREQGQTRSPMSELPSDRLDRLMLRLFGPPYRRVPRVEAALRPADSVYDRDTE